MKQPRKSNEDRAVQYTADYISFGVSFRLSAENESLLAQMFEMLPLDSKRIAAGMHAAERFTLLSSIEGAGYAGYVGDELTIENEELLPVLERLRQDLMVHVANHAPDRVFVHAGVVGWQGRAVVFPGRSFAGKTTLVAELVKAGATYYSDEYAVVDASGNVHPYARDLQMRERGSSEQRSLKVERLGGSSGLVPLPVGQVLFAEYAEGSEWAPEPVSNGMAVLEMMRHTIPVQRTPARVMSTLSSMMTGAAAWRSRRGEATATAHAILIALAEEVALP